MAHYINDLEASYLGDALPPYTAWTMGIKNLGGVVTVWPFNDANKGKPAAKFDIATYVSIFNAGRVSPQDVQQATSNNQYAYILAPVDVIEAAKALTKPTAREVALLPGGLSGWNPFANASTATKVVVGSAIVTGLAAVFGMFRGPRNR